jgi:hypothetical protein
MSWRASLLIRLAVSPDQGGLAHRLGRFRSRRRLRGTRDGDQFCRGLRSEYLTPINRP